MKKFLIKIAVFFIVVVLTYVGSVFMVVSLSVEAIIPNIKSVTGGYGNTLQRFKEIKEVGEVDVIFIGSSHCYRGFDTREFKKKDISCFNLGTSNQTPLNSYYLVQEYFDCVKPKKAVIEVFWGVFENNGQESFLDLISNTEIGMNHVKMLNQIPTALSLNSFTASFIKQLDEDFIENSPQQGSEIDKYVEGGFVERKPQDNKDYETLKTIEDFKLAVDFDGVQFQYLKKIIGFLNERNCSCILVLAPVPFEYKEAFTQYESFVQEMNSVAVKHGADFLNFVDSANHFDTRKDFYDLHHLNQTGVVKFNQMLIQKLVHLIE